MNDLEAQLANLTIKQEVVQKENECLYLCKKCKWNIVIVLLSLGLTSLTGINIKTIVDHYNHDTVNINYLISFMILQWVTWITFVINYLEKITILYYIFQSSFIGLNTIICYGDYILLINSNNNVNTVIMINKIIVLWYQIFVAYKFKKIS